MRAIEGFAEAPGGGMIVLPNPVTIGGPCRDHCAVGRYAARPR
jgi:hypothetical protein